MANSVATNPAGTAPTGIPGAAAGTASGPAPGVNQPQPEPPKSARAKGGGMFAGLANAKRAAEGAFRGNKTSFNNVSDLASIDPATQVEILKEIREGKVVDPARARLHKIVIEYLNQQLEPHNEIAPGIHSTGFSHVRLATSPSGVIENGWSPRDMTEIRNHIIDKSIAYASNPTGTPPHDAFTFQQIGMKQRPTQNNALFPSGPIHGVDGYGNQRMVMPLSGSAISSLLGDIDQTLPNDKFSKLGNDSMAWQRAAWLAALGMVNHNTLKEQLLELTEGQHADVISRLASLAESLQNNPVEKEDFMEPVLDAQGNEMFQKLKYPNGSKEDLERDLHQLTAVILKDVRNIYGEPLVGGADQRPGICAMTLINKLGVDCAVLNATTSRNGSSISELSVSEDGAEMIAESIDQDKSSPPADHFEAHVYQVPLVIITDEGVSVLLPGAPAQQTAGQGQQPGAAHASEDADSPRADQPEPQGQAS